jgi:hypothetical protein
MGSSPIPLGHALHFKTPFPRRSLAFRAAVYEEARIDHTCGDGGCRLASITPLAFQVIAQEDTMSYTRFNKSIHCKLTVY